MYMLDTYTGYDINRGMDKNKPTKQQGNFNITPDKRSDKRL